MIEVRELTKTYRAGFLGRGSIRALRGVSLEVHPGEVFGLLGPNGAGKTTLIKILLGIIRRSGGSASVLGNPAGSTTSRSRIGYLPENLRVERHHTARTALEFYGRLGNLAGKELDKRIDALIEMVGLRGRDREPVRRFSKGMGQRLGLAQALLNDPELLILDEPTDGLDPVGRADVRHLLRRLGGEGKSVLMNSHILQEVELVCDRVAIMTHGTLQSIGSIDQLTEKTRFGSLCIHIPAGQKEAALRALSTRGPVEVDETTSRELLTLKIEVKEQHEIDDAVDALRETKVSIAQLEIKRPSLEEIFLDIVRVSPVNSNPSAPSR